MQTPGTSQAVVMEGHDNRHTGFTALSKNRRRDEGKDVVYMNDIRALPEQELPHGFHGGEAIYTAKKGTHFAEGHVRDFLAASEEWDHIVPVTAQEGANTFDNSLLTTESTVSIVNKKYFHPVSPFHLPQGHAFTSGRDYLWSRLTNHPAVGNTRKISTIQKNAPSFISCRRKSDHIWVRLLVGGWEDAGSFDCPYP